MAAEPDSIFVWPLRVYYEDTDAGGVVYHAQYLKFLERARTEWLRAHGIEQNELAQAEGIVFVVTRVEISYLRPARFNDSLKVTVHLISRRIGRMRFEQNIVRTDASDEPLLAALVEVACVDRRRFRGRRIPEIILKKLGL